MTWLPLLLIDSSPNLRYLVLKELMGRPDNDIEVQELLELRTSDPLISDLIKSQKSDGSWDIINTTHMILNNKFQATVHALNRFGYLGFDSRNSTVKNAAEHVFSKQREDGSWPMPGKNQLITEESVYQMMPVQTAIPLLALASCGYATDKRAENAYEWLLAQRLEDGAWPVGIASGNYGGIAGYRKIAHSRWGCRSNTFAVLNCLALHPMRRKSEEASRALDLILGTDLKNRTDLGFVIARIIGLEKSQGRITYFAKFDITQLLNICWRLDVSIDDERLADFINFVKKEQGKWGLWEYKKNPIASRWISFDILRSLSRLDTNNQWISLEPRTPFQSYPHEKRRF